MSKMTKTGVKQSLQDIRKRLIPKMEKALKEGRFQNLQNQAEDLKFFAENILKFAIEADKPRHQAAAAAHLKAYAESDPKPRF